MNILEHPRFDLTEFSERWRRARLSALSSVLAKKSTSLQLAFPLQEEQLLGLIDTELVDSALRNVFDASRKLGLSAVRYLGMTLEISDFAEILPYFGTPCFREQWRSHHAANAAQAAQVLERKGCDALSKFGSFACDYWREALDGLVMGMGENERLSRHRSQGHGDSECVDVLFTEEFSFPRVVKENSGTAPEKNKFGPVNHELEDALKSIRKRFESMKIGLHLDGVSENTLYYRLEAEEGVLCGAGGKLLHESLSRELAKKFPLLLIKDAAPLAVYGGSS